MREEGEGEEGDTLIRSNFAIFLDFFSSIVELKTCLLCLLCLWLKRCREVEKDV